MRRAAFILSVAGLASILPGCARHGSGAAPHGLAKTANPATVADPGRTRFETYCAGCHLNEGPWMRGEAPPLEGSSWVKGPEQIVIRIVLHGLRGPIEVAGAKYNQEMPGFGPILTDDDLASLLSYVRARFGGGASPVAAEALGRLRAAHPGRMELWTVDELLKQP